MLFVASRRISSFHSPSGIYICSRKPYRPYLPVATTPLVSCIKQNAEATIGRFIAYIAHSSYALYFNELTLLISFYTCIKHHSLLLWYQLFIFFQGALLSNAIIRSPPQGMHHLVLIPRGLLSSLRDPDRLSLGYVDLVQRLMSIHLSRVCVCVWCCHVVL